MATPPNADIPTASMHRQFSEAELEQRHLTSDHGQIPSETAGSIRQALIAGTLRRVIR